MMIYSSKPWLKSYDRDISFDIDIPDVSLKDYFVNTAIEHSSRVAFHFLGMSMKFGELLEYSGRFAKALADRGFGKGDIIAINLPNTPQYLIAVVGAIRAGCAISGLSPLLMPDEMVYQINDCSAKMLITSEQLFNEKFLKISDKADKLQYILVTGVFDFLPDVVIYPNGKPIHGKNVLSFLELLKQSVNLPPEIPIKKDDICYLQYTGGTTGLSKGTILTHGNMVANISQFEHWLKIQKGKEIWECGFPMFHQAGLFIMTCALCWAATQILIPDPRNTQHIIKEMAQYQPTFLFNVPSLYMMLLSEPNFCKLDFASLKYCFSGAAPLPIETMNDLDRIVGENKIVEVWGMTETSPLITVNPVKNKKKPGSVGLPLPGTKFRIVDLNDGKTEVPIGQEGELICSGPQVMKGYLNKPRETNNALREHEGKLWMYTGDIGRMDQDGFVYVVDRAKDMLIVGGYKVFSSEVEDKLYKHPAIDLCAIVGVKNPDRPGSEIVKLVIQKSKSYKDKADEELKVEIMKFAKDTLAPYKVPKIYDFIDMIPLTSVGKIDKKALRQQL
jgi:long-chain acyl-CoA synthetase